jgi:hypothetical protein
MKKNRLAWQLFQVKVFDANVSMELINMKWQATERAMGLDRSTGRRTTEIKSGMIGVISQMSQWRTYADGICMPMVVVGVALLVPTAYLSRQLFCANSFPLPISIYSLRS